MGEELCKFSFCLSTCSEVSASARRRAQMPISSQTGLNMLSRTPGCTSVAAEEGMQSFACGEHSSQETLDKHRLSS